MGFGIGGGSCCVFVDLVWVVVIFLILVIYDMCFRDVIFLMVMFVVLLVVYVVVFGDEVCDVVSWLVVLVYCGFVVCDGCFEIIVRCLWELDYWFWVIYVGLVEWFKIMFVVLVGVVFYV